VRARLVATAGPVMDVLTAVQLAATAAVGEGMAWAWLIDRPRAAAWLLRTMDRWRRPPARG
jgi:hypothetical protein